MRALLLAMLLITAGPAGAAPTKTTPALRTFLQKQFPRDKAIPQIGSTSVQIVETAVIDGRRLILVYVAGGGWCGTGGCPLMILERTGSSFHVLGDVSISWPPIYLLRTTTHGYPDLAVWVQGGGILPGYEARLRFDGRKYPENPSILPARRMRGRINGTLLFSSAYGGEPLYPGD